MSADNNEVTKNPLDTIGELLGKVEKTAQKVESNIQHQKNSEDEKRRLVREKEALVEAERKRIYDLEYDSKLKLYTEIFKYVDDFWNSITPHQRKLILDYMDYPKLTHIGGSFFIDWRKSNESGKAEIVHGRWEDIVRNQRGYVYQNIYRRLDEDNGRPSWYFMDRSTEAICREIHEYLFSGKFLKVFERNLTEVLDRANLEEHSTRPRGDS